MRGLIAVVAFVFIASPALAQRKDCEELKAEIDAKIKANGVPAYTLDIVTNEEAEKQTDKQVVGSCDGGTKKILYKRG
jgi:hypothetical protein